MDAAEKADWDRAGIPMALVPVIHTLWQSLLCFDSRRASFLLPRCRWRLFRDRRGVLGLRESHSLYGCVNKHRSGTPLLLGLRD